MIKKYNTISLLWGIPGIVLQVGGQVLSEMGQSTIQTDETAGAALALSGCGVLLFGTVLLMIGLAYYAKAKGRHPAWCAMGLLSIIGLIVLALLKDLSSTTEVA